MSGTDDGGAARHAVDNLRGLIDQQEYEFQRLMADLQLTVRDIDFVVDHRRITADAVDTLQAAVTNCKHDIRNARHELGEAVDRLREVANQLMQLEWQDGDQ